jgi:uncharacterized membrane protein
LVERSFESGGLVFAVCARDTGIHIGFAAALIAAAGQFRWSKHKGRPVPGDLPTAGVIAFLLILITPMAFDGVSSYLGLRETTNLIRYITGVLTGIACGSLVAPVLAAVSASTDLQLKAYNKPPSLISHLAGSLLICLLFYLVYPYLSQLSAFLAVAALLTMVISLNLLIYSVTIIKLRIERFSTWFFWSSAALVASLLELAVFNLAHFLMLEVMLGMASLFESIVTLL